MSGLVSLLCKNPNTKGEGRRADNAYSLLASNYNWLPHLSIYISFDKEYIRGNIRPTKLKERETEHFEMDKLLILQRQGELCHKISTEIVSTSSLSSS